MKHSFIVCLFLIVVCGVSSYAQGDNSDSASVSSLFKTIIGENAPIPGILGQFNAQVNKNSDSVNSYFSFQAVRLYLSGNAGEKFQYFLQGDVNGNFKLLDMKLSYVLSHIFRFDFGQFKAPFGNEFLRNDANLTFVNRSLVASSMGVFRQQGAQVSYTSVGNRFSAAGGIFNGSGINSHDNLISLMTGKFSGLIYDGEDTGKKIKITVGGSIAYTHDYNDFANMLPNENIFSIVNDRLMLVGANASILMGNTTVEYEGINGVADNVATYGGIDLDIIHRLFTDVEIAGRYDRYGYYQNFRNYYPDKPILEFYSAGGNWYPLEHTKLRADFTQQKDTNVKSFILQFQYAINNGN
ncbi:MAG: porin [Bacteroidota bacterium]